MITPEMLRLYGLETPQKLAVHDTSHGANDLRMVYVLESRNWEARNKDHKECFQHTRTGAGWVELIEHYNHLGIYCPGSYTTETVSSAFIDGYLVYAEEYMAHDLASEREDSLNYEPRLYESIGLVAANPAPLVPWNTAFCLFDKFDKTDEYDENLECAIMVRDLYANQIPEYAERVNKLFLEYCHRRERFEPLYRVLPKAVFQGDLNRSNILVNDTGDFAGLIDFNLSGTETILNYAFCESFCALDDGEAEIGLLMDPEALKERDRRTAQNLAWIGKHYQFTDAEREVFNEYYNIVAPFRWTYQGFFMRLLTNRIDILMVGNTPV